MATALPASEAGGGGGRGLCRGLPCLLGESLLKRRGIPRLWMGATASRAVVLQRRVSQHSATDHGLLSAFTGTSDRAASTVSVVRGVGTLSSLSMVQGWVYPPVQAQASLKVRRRPYQLQQTF